MSAIIYCFHNAPKGREGVAYAMREDGRVLASHFCTHEGFAYMDLGVDPDRDWSEKRAIYAQECPDGFELVWIDDVASDPRLAAAYKLNQELARQEKSA